MYNLKLKTLRGKHVSNILWHWIQQWFLGYNIKGTGNKKKNRQIEVDEKFKNSYIKGYDHRVKRPPMK